MSTCGVCNINVQMHQAYNFNRVFFPDDDNYDHDDYDTDDGYGNDDCDDHGDNAGDDDGDRDDGSFSPAQDYLMHNDTNDDVDDKQPLLLIIVARVMIGNVMDHCIAMYMHFMSSYIRHNCSVYGNLLQTSCVT